MKSKNKASSLLWSGVRIYHADPDDPPDVAESDEYDEYSDIVNSVTADESLYAEEPEGRIRATFGRNMPRSAGLEVSLQPVLNPNEAKHYAHSAAPASRGNMYASILNLSGRCVFI